MDRSVSEIMTSEVVTLREEDNLNDIAAGMDQYQLRHLPVVDGKRLVGLVSHRDLLRFVASSLDRSSVAPLADARRREATFVGEVMTRNPQTVRPETPAIEAAGMLLEARFGCLPVVDAAGDLVGIITEQDLLRLLVTLLDRQPAQATET